MNDNLYDDKNYNNNFENENDVIKFIIQYEKIINNYLDNIISNIKTSNMTHYKFIIINGLKALNHIFNLLLLYTKNLNLTLKHCEKSHYFYVEFINQISYDNQNFLQLNSIDAILFIYKKTIYDINPEYRKKFTLDNENDNNILKKINTINKVIYKIRNYIINNSKITIDDKNNIMKHNDDIITLTKKIIMLNNEKISNLNNFIDILLNKKNDTSIFIDLIEAFIKKNKKKEIRLSLINNRLQSEDYDSLIHTNKFIPWLFHF
uniref:Uncharacterized protein n=1 Tax=viral metagenome TaxID=1070528 RepID=A0A6C0KEA1_9ZZZZ